MTTGDDVHLELVDLEPDRATFRREVLLGLSKAEKTLPCKYFYDEEGSRLFDRICELPEYYLTRTEMTIMRERAGEMAAALGARCLLVELGSGSSVKTRLLLDRLCDPVAYVPVDISREHLVQAAADVAADYPQVQVLPVCADYTAPFELPHVEEAARTAIYFPGSTVGNFSRQAALAFLARMTRLAGQGGALLIGVDLPKDRATLDAAYDDSQGVTAAFNLNLLARINRELGADFRLDRFTHRAAYNEAGHRVEIFLVSRERQDVTVAGQRFRLDAGEAICTEHSHKYAPEEFRALAGAAGWQGERVWIDARGWFSVHYLVSRGAAGES